MKKAKKSNSSNQKKSKKAQASALKDAGDISRRDVLGSVRNWAIGLAVVGGGGLFVARTVSATIKEHDLSRVANGTPTVVQIHDPQCSLCRALQKETKGALKGIDKQALDYVIANIRTSEGSSFAARYNARHVTLLLFDAEGNLQSVLEGRRNRAELRSAFERLISG